MSKEVLKIALEALEPLKFVGKRMDGGNPKIDEAIAAIKTALEAKDGECKYCTDGCPACDARKLPEQEPVGEIVDAIEGAFKCSFTKMLPVGTKLYTTPPQRTWVGLTNDEVNNFAAGCHLGNSVQGAIYKAEAKLKEKNT